MRGESLVRGPIGGERLNTEHSGGRLRHLLRFGDANIFYLDPFLPAGRAMPLGSELTLVARKRREP